WLGFDQPKSLGSRETGGGVAMPIWLDYMKDALKGVPEEKQRPRPDGLLVENGELYFSEFPPGQRVGGQAIVDALAALAQGGLAPRRQPDAGVTYAAKLYKAEAALDCSLPAAVLARRVRAFNPVPGATIRLPGLDDPVKVWRAQALEQAAGGTSGAVLRADAQGIDIATGQGVLRLLELQKAGGKRQPVDVFVRGWQP
ncbi:formyl transferase, C-terminal domain protein, partial [Bordetella pertussis B200]